MSVRNSYRFVAEAKTRDGAPLGALPLAPDWEPAAHWSYLEGMRRGSLPPQMRFGSGWVVPQWHEALGRPYIDGVRLCFSPGPSDQAETAHAVGFVVPNSYFQGSAEQAAAGLVSDGKITVGEVFTFRVCAYFDPEETTTRETAVKSSNFSLEEIAQPLPLQSRELQAALTQASYFGADSISKHQDIPLLVQHFVLDEAADLTWRAGDQETGGILIGHLCRDTETPEIFAKVTTQIPAQHSVADRTTFQFTPETWSAAQAAIALRGREEIMLGWWHSHPHFCSNCPAEQRDRCPLKKPFFSNQDRALHRAVFPRAFDVALLMSNLGRDHLSYDVFGWRQGMIVPRAYHVSTEADCPGKERHCDPCLALPVGQKTN